MFYFSQAGAGFVFPSRLRWVAYGLFQESSQNVFKSLRPEV